MNQIASRCGFACVVLWIAAAGCSSKSTGSFGDGGTGMTGSTGTGSTGSGTGSTGTGSVTTGVGTGTGGGDNCAAACAKLDAANCAGDTPGDCAVDICGVAACAAQKETLAACILGATVTCEPGGGGAGAAPCNDALDAYVDCRIASGG